MDNHDNSPNSLPFNGNIDLGKYKTLFNPDLPIESEEDDKLERKDFAKHLAHALCNWTGEESFVAALNGPWGSGKTSVIKMTEKYIKDSSDNTSPTIIHLNPWTISENGDIQKHFFDQIANELELNDEFKRDALIAKELRLFESKLSFVPSITNATNIRTTIIIYSGLSVLSGNQLLSSSNSSEFSWNLLLSIVALFISLVGIIKVVISKVAEYKEKKIEYHKKSIVEIRKEIEGELRARERKLLIIIDDIDRLDKKEIRQLFKLVRINANFPNTIYLMVFDREIVEKSLDEEYGVSGKEYLSKIVQARFDIPHVNLSNIKQYLWRELERIIHSLPDVAMAYIRSENVRFREIMNTLVPRFFNNVRDVKRFINGLKFNLAKIQGGEAMEINLIDFIALEALRLFLPDLYIFIKNNKYLLIQDDEIDTKNPIEDRNKFKERLLSILGENENETGHLLSHLFPQISFTLDRGLIYDAEEKIYWEQGMRVCTSEYFDCYFTLTPGGGANEISQHELRDLLKSSASLPVFESTLKSYMGGTKFDKILLKLHRQVSYQTREIQANQENLIQALFNISDELNHEAANTNLNRLEKVVDIVCSLLNLSFTSSILVELLKKVTKKSLGLLGPIKTIERLSSFDKVNSIYEFDISEKETDELRELGSSKIYDYGWDRLVNHRDLPKVLTSWKVWDYKDGLEEFLNYVTDDKEKFIQFLSKFFITPGKVVSGGMNTRMFQEFDYESLNLILAPKQVKVKLEKLTRDKPFYEANKQIIDSAVNYIEEGIRWYALPF